MREEISHGIFIATTLSQRCREEQQLGLANSDCLAASFVPTNNVDLNDSITCDYAKAMINPSRFVADLGRFIMAATILIVGLLLGSRVELVFISRIELHDLVTLPKLLNDIAMSIRDKFIGWLKMLD